MPAALACAGNDTPTVRLTRKCLPPMHDAGLITVAVFFAEIEETRSSPALPDYLGLPALILPVHKTTCIARNISAIA
ncbi:hypothetical protein EF096_17300 [Pseudomonas neustonica]|uniref:Uncharacterized protein n=1 Tax=Pseudomonas neustonica TaxID=2487346 RepID=A0ABX9XDW9_9PSED|nr:hypothetical protein EF096_17300 [Pseudomonas neustonica]ROZ84235.1 hypothetical protein EF099_07965 [Pseudomonas sp. SSM44]